MTNKEQAKILRDRLRRRLCGYEIALCEMILEGRPLSEEQEQWFESVKTEFAWEIAEEANREAAA